MLVREPLSREQVIHAIERTGGDKVPLMLHKWWGEGLYQRYGSALTAMADSYPDDILVAWHIQPGNVSSPIPNPHYRWGYKADYSAAERHGIGKTVVLLDDWDELSLLLDDFPSATEPGIFEPVRKALSPTDHRYKVGAFWHFYHERFWAIVGMENLMMAYYDEMDGLKKLGWRLAQYYRELVDQYAALGFDAIFTSDDLGHQTGPMMSPAVFEELYLPLYKDTIGYIHSKGMHFMLHSCGDNTLLMDYLVEAGVDVFHPIQAGCMDFAETAKQYGDKMTFLAGMDVQHTLPEGTPQEVEAYINHMVDVLYQKEGGLLLAAGNGILPDTPLENIEAMLHAMALCR